MKQWLVKMLVRLLRTDIEKICVDKLKDYDKRLCQAEKDIRVNNEKIEKEFQNPYEIIDYEDFENHFRGSRELIKKRQMEYLPYFKNRKHVIDLGCGRGEFLELMKENGINASGVDLYKPFVNECQKQGLKVQHGDALQYLKQCDRIDGIFVGQLVEHMKIAQILQLCQSGYERLEDGGVLIIETPNPMSLAIFTHAFYIDPSHNKPVHPLTLQYLLYKTGFKKADILFTENSKLNEQIPNLNGLNIENLQEFNESMNKITKLLYGSQDYAIIAIK